MQVQRHYNFWDRLCLGLDQAVRALQHTAKTSGQAYPGRQTPEADLSETQRKHSAGLMRINHAGEVCAQALYHGQGVVSRSREVQVKMQLAAMEEGDHLNWCKQRLDELGSHSSYLNPLWYGGSFCIGMVAGMVGDAWSLGFVAETERQVIKHLAHHLETLPSQDDRSYQVLKQMQADEAKHRDEAVALGARDLPAWIKMTMAMTSKVMVKSAYWI
jgi:ubiquinone biosynthesis monooxygenase Coq7